MSVGYAELYKGKGSIISAIKFMTYKYNEKNANYPLWGN